MNGEGVGRTNLECCLLDGKRGGGCEQGELLCYIVSIEWKKGKENYIHSAN